MPSAIPLLDPETALLRRIRPSSSSSDIESPAYFDGGQMSGGQLSKRDPEVAAPLVLDHREKKSYHFPRTFKSPMKAYFHR